MSIIVTLLFLFINHSFSSECKMFVTKNYQLCLDGNDYFVKSISGSKIYKRTLNKWEVCEESTCQPLSNKSKALYFETSISLLKHSEFSASDRNKYENLYCQRVEQKHLLSPFNDSGQKSSAVSSLIDLDRFFIERIREVKVTSAYHQKHFDNLEKMISSYRDNYRAILTSHFEQSSDYNIYEKPATYISDLYNHRAELIYARSQLDWLVQVYDVHNFNISLNLKKNQRIKALFDKFTSVTGFPNNIEKLKEIIQKKLDALDKEEDKIHEWILEVARKEQLAIDLSRRNDARFNNLRNDSFRDISRTTNRRFNELLAEGKIEEAKDLIDEFELRTTHIERSLSLQATNSYRQNSLKDYKRIRNLNLASYRDSIKYYLKEKRVLKPPREDDNNSGTTGEGRDQQTDSNIEMEVRYYPDNRTGEMVPVQLDKKVWEELGDRVIGVGTGNDGKSYLILKNNSGEPRAIDLTKLLSLQMFLQAHHAELQTRPEIDLNGKAINEVFSSIDDNRDALSRTAEGAQVVARKDELESELTLSMERRDASENRINEDIRTIEAGQIEDIKFPTVTKPPVATANTNAISEDMAFNLIYFGVMSFSGGIGQVANAAEFINMLVTNTDFLGNDVESVDVVITGLAILIPQVRTIPGMAKALKGLRSYLQKGGVAALANLRKALKKGNMAFTEILENAVKVQKKGINLFEDFHDTIWKYGSELISAADSFKLKTKKSIIEMADFARLTLGNQIGAVGDIGVALRKSYVLEVGKLSKYVRNLKNSGESLESIARKVSKRRRDLGVKYKVLTPKDKLEEIFSRNLEKYGDQWGPTVEYLRSKGKSWDEIIESATRSGGSDLGL